MTRLRTLLLHLVLALTAVLALAACGGGGDAGDGPGGDGRALEVLGTDALAFEPSQLSAPAGEITVELTSEPGVNHTFVIEELGDREVVEAGPGETASGTVELEPGTYTFYCSVPGHREAGMEGILTVE